MAHVVIAPFARISGIIATLGIAERLERSGHRVTYVGTAEGVGKMADVGIKGVVFPSNPRPRVPLPHNASVLTRWAHRRERLDAAVQALGVDTFPSLVETLQPDVLLADLERPHLALAALGAGLPTALVSTVYATERRPGVPPLHAASVPGDGWRGSRLGARALWLKHTLGKRARNARSWASTAGTDRLGAYRTLARRLGVDTGHIDPYQWLIPFDLVGLPRLYAVPEELEFPSPRPDHVVYAQTPPARPALEGAAPSDRLRTVMDRHRAGSERRLVYASFGACFKGDDLAFLRRVVKAVAPLEGLDVVLGLGGRLGPAALGDVPDHVVAESWVPQPDVLEVADAALVHGGPGTLGECVWFGVPVVTYPFAVNDQLGTASRAVYHGLAAWGDRTDGAEAIRQTLQTVLDDDAHRTAARRLQQSYHATAAEDRVAPFIERLLSDPTWGRPQQPLIPDVI